MYAHYTYMRCFHRPAIAVLVARAGDPEPEVRRAAVEALVEALAAALAGVLWIGSRQRRCRT